MEHRTATPVRPPAGRPSNRRVGVAPYRALAGLQVLDVATTWVILSNWSARRERNPVVATLIENTGLHVAMLSLLVIKLAVVYVLHQKGTGVKLISAVYSLVVVNNLLIVGLWLFG